MCDAKCEYGRSGCSGSTHWWCVKKRKEIGVDVRELISSEEDQFEDALENLTGNEEEIYP